MSDGYGVKFKFWLNAGNSKKWSLKLAISFEISGCTENKLDLLHFWYVNVNILNKICEKH